MKPEEVSAKKLGNRIELRIHGWGNTGKGDRWALLSRKEARRLAYTLLAQSEDLDSSKEIAA
jgi:hypothetical protein